MSGERDAGHPWLAIYAETVEPLYRYVSRRAGGERQLAEDVVQETWLRALDRHPDARGLAAPLAWLRTVARNLLASHFRRRRPVSVPPAVLERILAGGEPRGEDEAALVHRGIARLRRSHALVIEAFHLDGRDVRSIATGLGISERAVEGRLRRAREALRARLAPLLRQGDER
jgi:RNA polymerase sigma-70 factor (ECF subfamily)